MSFLPKDHKIPGGSSSFMKFQDGANRFRILSDASIGWEGWKDNKPFRREGIDQNINADEVDMDEKYKKPKINFFWCVKVFDYADDSVKLLELTQKTVMRAIKDLLEDADWGEPNEYDLSVEKIKKGDRTTYSVKSYPHKKLSPDFLELVEASDLDARSIFKDGEEDFADFKPKAKAKK